MNANLRALIQACDGLGLVYRFHHPTQNLVEVCTDQQSFLFANWATPCNPQSIRQLCTDKDYFYQFFAPVVRMPRTLAFLNPDCDPKYAHYLQANSIDAIVAIAQSQLTYPMIVKRNSGSLGQNVFKTGDAGELAQALRLIFDPHRAAYDYVALVQEWIPIQTEYRVIYLNHKLVFAYAKSTVGARFVGNLSPLHWEDARAVLVTEPALLEAIAAFCQPLFKRLPIPFCGLDVAQDHQGQWWLIEANSSPGFDHIIAAGGESAVVQLYKQMLLFLQHQN